MSSHRCIRCQDPKTPDSWLWYSWLPQPGEELGSHYWVLCDSCDTELTRKAFEAEDRMSTPSAPLGEGMVVKGGLSAKPTTPAPPPPKGQGGVASNTPNKSSVKQ